jgi:hypothetical protein
MDLCPHCGEPIEEDAPSCPHCGSDNETGWNPEAEYLSLDLPDDDDEDDGAAPLSYRDSAPLGARLTARKISGAGPYIGGGVVLTLAFGLLIAAGLPHYQWGIFAVAGLLLACLLYFGWVSRDKA